MTENAPRGLPAKTYLPIVALLAAIFLGILGYFVSVGFGVTGSVFGKAAKPGTAAAQEQGSQNSVEGGPPAAVLMQLNGLRARIAKHPTDDVAITQLADLYLAANKFADAIPLYQQALKANPHNVAAQTGLEQAREGLQASQ